MRWLIAAGLTLVATAVVAAQAPSPGREESFTLEPQDRIIVEARGCHAECVIQSGGRRRCEVRGADCHAACQALPECRPEGAREPITVCAIVRELPF